MFRSITDIFSTLATVLPGWALALLGAVLAVFLVPGWWHGVRVKQMRNRVRRLARAVTTEQRAYLESELFHLAAGKPRRLVALADEAIRLGQTVVWRRALAEIEASGSYRKDLRRLREKVLPEQKIDGHPLEAVVALERLLELGNLPGARARWEQAKARFPEDQELRRFGERLQREEDAGPRS